MKMCELSTVSGENISRIKSKGKLQGREGEITGEGGRNYRGGMRKLQGREGETTEEE